MPAINHLPNELLLQILSYLQYCDLRDCSRTTKTLRAIAHDPTLDSVRFRSSKIIHKHGLINMDTFVIHPWIVLSTFAKWMQHVEEPYVEMDECGCEFRNPFDEDLSKEEWEKHDKERCVPIIRTTAVNENATSPPVSRIHFEDVLIKNKSGVTVGDVFKALIRRNMEQKEHWSLDEPMAMMWYHDWDQLGRRCGREEIRNQRHVVKECKDIVIWTHWGR